MSDTTTGRAIATTEPQGGWRSWLDSWNRQQERHVQYRDDMIQLAFECMERLHAAPGRMLDLACGPGTISGRAIERFPTADITAVDLDPVLLAIGRNVLGDRVRWVEGDLRSDTWHHNLDGPFDAVCTATAVHWLDGPQTRAMLSGLATLVRPGGVFVNYDTLPLSLDTGRLPGLAGELRNTWIPGSPTAAHDYQGWWSAVEAEPAFAELLARRDKRLGGRSDTRALGLSEMLGALTDAGFSEAAPMAQVGSRHLVVAVR